MAAKMYFIYGFRKLVKNENKALVKDRIPSIRSIIKELLNLIDSNKELKLAKSLNDYLLVAKDYTKQSAVYNLTDYKFELNIMLKKLDEYIDLRKKEEQDNYKKIIEIERELKLMLRNIHNKLSRPKAFLSVLSQMKNEKSFARVEMILSYVLNELVYDGYSLKYLDEWLSSEVNLADVNESNADKYIESFMSLKKDMEYFKFYTYVYNEDELLDSLCTIGAQIKIKKVDYDKVDDSIGTDNISFLQAKNEYDLFELSITAMDVYRAMNTISEKLSEYYQLVLKVGKSGTKQIATEKMIVFHKGKYIKVINRNYDEKILYSLVESKERRDIRKFIDYRKKMYQANLCTDEIMTIQRSLNLLNNNEFNSLETRLINTWSAVEYVLTF